MGNNGLSLRNTWSPGRILAAVFKRRRIFSEIMIGIRSSTDDDKNIKEHCSIYLKGTQDVKCRCVAECRVFVGSKRPCKFHRPRLCVAL